MSTTPLGFEKPDPGASDDEWGYALNRNFDRLDAQLQDKASRASESAMAGYAADALASKTDAETAKTQSEDARDIALEAAAGSGGPLAYFASYDEDEPSLTTALSGLADGIYEVLADETHGGAATRYTVAAHVATYQTTLEAVASGSNLTPVASYDDVPELIGRGSAAVNEVAQALINEITFRADAVVDARLFESLQAALDAWAESPGKDFVAPGVWAIDEPVTIRSPKAGSSAVFGEVRRGAGWAEYTEADSLIDRGALIILDIDAGAEVTWGNYIYVGKIDGGSLATTWNDFTANGIENRGWQQCVIEYGYATGLVAAVRPTNASATTPTVRYISGMTRGNLWGVLGQQTQAAASGNMAEGSMFEFNWASRNWFAFACLGWGSAYTSFNGGSHDFNGDHSVALQVADSATAQKAVLGAIVTQGAATGVCLGPYYREADRTYYILVGDSVRTDGNPSLTNFDGATSIYITGVAGAIGVIGVRTPQADETGALEDDKWWYPGIQCIAPSTYPVTRWNVRSDFGAGVTFGTAAQAADSAVYEVTQVKKPRLPVGGAYIYPDITSGAVVFGGARYVTSHRFPETEVQANALYSAKKATRWKHNGAGVTTEFVSGAAVVDVFSAADLGYGGISGRFPGAVGDPANDTVGMWRVSAFGLNADGSAVAAEWLVAKTATSDYGVVDVSNTSPMVLAGGNAGLALSGNLTSDQAAAGAAWSFRLFVTRVGAQ